MFQKCKYPNENEILQSFYFRTRRNCEWQKTCFFPNHRQMFTFFFRVSWLLNNLNVYFRTTLRTPQHCRCYCTHIYKFPELHITLLCPNMSLRTNECISILRRNISGCRIFAQCIVRCLLCRNSSWLKELFILSLALRGGLRYFTHCSEFLSKGHVYGTQVNLSCNICLFFSPFFFSNLFSPSLDELSSADVLPLQGIFKFLCHKNINSNNFYWSPFLPLQEESPSLKGSRMLSATFINYSFILINYASQIFHYHWGYQLRLLQLLAIFIPLIHR